eukprot:gene29959-18024_t
MEALSTQCPTILEVELGEIEQGQALSREEVVEQYKHSLESVLLLMLDSGSQLQLAVQLMQEEAGSVTAVHEACNQLVACLHLTQTLMAPSLLSRGLCPAHVCGDVLRTIRDVTQLALEPLGWEVNAHARSAASAAAGPGSQPGEAGQRQSVIPGGAATSAEECASLAKQLLSVLSAASAVVNHMAAQLPEAYLKAHVADSATSSSNHVASSATTPGGQGTIATALLQCITSLCTVLVPHDSSAPGPRSNAAETAIGGPRSNGSETSDRLPVLPSSAPSAWGQASSSVLDSAGTKSLQAGQALITRAAATDLLPHVGLPLIQLGVRMLYTAQPGVPLTAAKRFLDTAVSIAGPAASSAGWDDSLAGDAGLPQRHPAAWAAIYLADSLQAVQDVQAVHDVQLRTPVVVSCLMNAAASCTASSSAQPAELAASDVQPCTAQGVVAQRHVLSVLPHILMLDRKHAWGLDTCCSTRPGARCFRKELLKHLLGASRPPMPWAVCCLVTLGPSVVSLAHSVVLEASEASQAVSDGDRGVTLITEMYRMLIATVALVNSGPPPAVQTAGSSAVENFGFQGSASERQEAVMKVLVPLLLEGAAPPPSASTTPALRDAALRIVSSMSTSANRKGQPQWLALTKWGPPK